MHTPRSINGLASHCKGNMTKSGSAVWGTGEGARKLCSELASHEMYMSAEHTYIHTYLLFCFQIKNYNILQF